MQVQPIYNNLPHFIIPGAMKSGTTTLRHILNHHENIFIPNPEIFFFDIDDIDQHPDFFIPFSNCWTAYNYDKNFSDYLSWYKSFFTQAHDHQLIGEHSTTYLVSSKAPSRIAQLLPDVKLIFMLRDPVARTYSHYWHLVNAGHPVYSFEDTIQYIPENIIKRSFYKEQIERYIQYFPDENMKFVIFEDFIIRVQDIVNDVCEWLNLESTVDTTRINTHQHASKGFRSLALQILFNHLFRNSPTSSQSHLPNMPNRQPNKILRIVNKWFKKINTTKKKRYPKMKPETRRFLEELFSKENKGLSKLTGINLSQFWPYMDDAL
jgi:hypothetical protein